MNHANVSRYLLSFAAAEEVAADPSLLPWFLLIVQLVPPTVLELVGERQCRIAA